MQFSVCNSPKSVAGRRVFWRPMSIWATEDDCRFPVPTLALVLYRRSLRTRRNVENQPLCDRAGLSRRLRCNHGRATGREAGLWGPKKGFAASIPPLCNIFRQVLRGSGLVRIRGGCGRGRDQRMAWKRARDEPGQVYCSSISTREKPQVRSMPTTAEGLGPNQLLLSLLSSSNG